LSGELQRQRHEPVGLTRARTSARDRGVLLKESQEERTLGWELTVNRALGEAGSERHFVEGREVEPALGEYPQPCLKE
jgi:hypothetical protein